MKRQNAVLMTVVILIVLATARTYWAQGPGRTGIGVPDPYPHSGMTPSDGGAGKDKKPTSSGVAAVPLEVENWKDWIAHLPDYDQPIVESFRSRYAEAYDFSNKEQLAWMILRGYPTPDEIIRAAKMPLEELINLGMTDSKASMLARDRLLSEAAEDGERLADHPSLAKISALQMADRSRNCSPFAYYVEARYYEDLALGGRRIDSSRVRYSLAARAIVAELGDPRVRPYSSRLAESAVTSGQEVMQVAAAAARLRSRLPSNCPTDRIPTN